MTAPAAGRPFGGAPVSTSFDPFTRKAALAMTITHTDPTDPWTESDDDDVPMRPDGNVRIAWRDTPRHYIEQTALVYLHHFSCLIVERSRNSAVHSVENAFADTRLI